MELVLIPVSLSCLSTLAFSYSSGEGTSGEGTARHRIKNLYPERLIEELSERTLRVRHV